MSAARPTVLIAGGGVGGLEALLMVRRLLGERVRPVVLAPEAEFTYRQYAVAEPFSYGEVARFDLGDLVANAGGRLRHDALSGVNVEEKIAFTEAGAEIHFDALVIAVGAEAVNALPGALTYRGPASNADVHSAALAMDRGEISRLAFAVPASAHWSLPLYELALLAAAHLTDIGDRPDGVHLVTAETEPLAAFGTRVGQRVRTELDRAGVKLHSGVAPARMTVDGLSLMDGSVIPCDRTIALPRLEVSPLGGIEQGPHGFISTDARMRIGGSEDIYAIGDASWFPIKQGGLAAQQADVAAKAIAARLGATAEDEPFRPELRAALLTADGPIYLRSGEEHEPAAISDAPLWWPPTKVAGRLLAPFIAYQARQSNQPLPALIDLEPASAEEVEDHRDATDLAFIAAKANARSGDYAAALRWLDVAERLDLVLPPEYSLRREQWQRELRPTSQARWLAFPT
jgi:sulfide:quinone oxidoreductase